MADTTKGWQAEMRSICADIHAKFDRIDQNLRFSPWLVLLLFSLALLAIVLA